MLRVLHTADWHLGRTLGTLRRLDESRRFLDWLVDTIEREEVDVLLIAGDVFDSTTPSPRALETYHDFLAKVFRGRCQHVVVIAGNHDSPLVLEATASVLKSLDIHVIGSARASIDEEALVLRDGDGMPLMIVAAVPYLRECDVRRALADESLTDKDQQLVAGIARHYADVAQASKVLRQQIEETTGRRIPMVAMGHLFATCDPTACPEMGDGVRDLYVGSLGQLGASLFDSEFDYVALGHLHVPHAIPNHGSIRYSGSPIPMGFGECSHDKSVVVLEFDGDQKRDRLITIPCFQKLIRIAGCWEEIEAAIQSTLQVAPEAWLEITYHDAALCPDLDRRVDLAIQGTALQVLKVIQRSLSQESLRGEAAETLSDLSPAQVFERRLAEETLPDDQQQELRSAFSEILAELTEEGLYQPTSEGVA